MLKSGIMSCSDYSGLHRNICDQLLAADCMIDGCRGSCIVSCNAACHQWMLDLMYTDNYGGRGTCCGSHLVGTQAIVVGSDGG